LVRATIFLRKAHTEPGITPSKMNLHEDFCGVMTGQEGISNRTCTEKKTKNNQQKTPPFSQILPSPDTTTLEPYAVLYFMQGPLEKF